MERIGIWLVSLLPLGYIMFGVMTEVSPDPVKFIYIWTGTTALVLLMLSLVISPLKRQLHVNLLKYRRLVGLFAFFYATLHFINFAIIDAELDLAFIIKESAQKPFVFVGSALFLILLFMAATSTKKLFRKYGTYHKIIYGGIVLGVLHYSWAQKVLEWPQFLAMGVAVVLLGERLHVRMKNE